MGTTGRLGGPTRIGRTPQTLSDFATGAVACNYRPPQCANYFRLSWRPPVAPGQCSPPAPAVAKFAKCFSGRPSRVGPRLGGAPVPIVVLLQTGLGTSDPESVEKIGRPIPRSARVCDPDRRLKPEFLRFGQKLLLKFCRGNKGPFSSTLRISRVPRLHLIDFRRWPVIFTQKFARYFISGRPAFPGQW